MYSTLIKNYSKLITEQTMYVLFVRPNQKLCTVSVFTNAHAQRNFGTILDLTDAFCQINRSVFLCKMLYLV